MANAIHRIYQFTACQLLKNLYNVSSGIPVDDELGDSILSVNDVGRKLYDDFIEARIKSTAVNIHDPIKRQKRTLFKDVGKKVAIIAPNGLYPMPKAFPLSGVVKTPEELLQGFAWYFYHASTNTFLIDYKVPMKTLSSWLTDINPSSLPVTIIGYSQGGYLAPFVAMEYSKVGALKKVIGINCSFREDLMSEVPSFPMSLIQGKEDTIIDTTLSSTRFEALKKRGLQGDYIRVENADHKLTLDIAQEVISLL